MIDVGGAALALVSSLSAVGISSLLGVKLGANGASGMPLRPDWEQEPAARTVHAGA